MKITIVQVGKTKQTFFSEAEREYLKRLSPFVKVDIVTLKESSVHSTSEADRERAKKEEGERILEKIPRQSVCVVLDERGKQMSSVAFADFIGTHRDSSQNITFIIGGSFGLSDAVKNRASVLLSFSQFTFTHEMIRTLVLEQVYRAFTILAGKTYHY